MLNAKVRDNEDCTVSAGGGWQPDVRQPRGEIRGRRSGEIPESGCDFVLHDADGESVMTHDCPEFGGGGGSRGGGAKAVEGYRSPSPGGTPARLGENVRPWGLRQIPESKCQVRSCCSLESQEIPESRRVGRAQDVEDEGITRGEKTKRRRGSAEGGGSTHHWTGKERGVGDEFGRASGGRTGCRLGSRRAAGLHPYAGWATCATSVGNADGLGDGEGPGEEAGAGNGW